MATESIEERQVRHARMELSLENYDRLRAAADRERRSISSYIRCAVLDRITADEAGAGLGPKPEASLLPTAASDSDSVKRRR
jgi:hypothetical protein